jgi:hypothetical protein
MATSTPNPTSTYERGSERVQELGEQVVEAGRRVSLSMVDAYDATARTVADYQARLGESTRIDWIAQAARAQADLTREVARISTSTARELLK